MKKKILALLLAVCLLVGCLPLSASAATPTSGKCGENVIWNFDRSTGTLTISGKGPMYDYDCQCIVFHSGPPIDTPWLDLNVKNVKIEQGVTRIGDAAFGYCDMVDFISIPNSVTSIGFHAFHLCDSIKSIVIPEKVSKIDNDLDNPFAGCEQLEEIIVDPKNKNYASVDGVLYNKSKSVLIAYPGGKEDHYSIPNGVKEIGNGAFEDDRDFTSVTIPNSVTKIGSTAFSSTGLRSIAIPESVREIGFMVFDDNTTIYGIKGSEADAYAHLPAFSFLNYNFVAVDNIEQLPEPLPTQFKDVKSSDYFCEAVKWAVEKEITSGTSKTQFSPNAPCTRGQAVTFLWRAAGKPEPANSGTGFSDVKPGAYYEKAVQWAVENGITSGTGKGKFSPEATCTRAQIVTLLYRAENSPAVSNGSSFSDVSSSAYYKDAVQWAAENEITSGTGNGKFSPENKCVRGQIVTFLYRYSGE